MTLLRYHVDERGYMRPSPDGEYVAFHQYEMLGHSNTKSWALAKSLQAQVDILELMARRLELKMSNNSFANLDNIAADIEGTLLALKRHRES